MGSPDLQIVADENISGLEHFEKFASLIKIPGRDFSASIIKHADAILVRSVTRVDQALLKGTSVKFVGSTTSGIDHVDTGFLDRQKISFAYAPGSNANSVVQYVMAAMALLSEKHQFDWRDLRMGIIGAGNIGGLLASYLDRLGIQVLIYDPFLDTGHPLAKHLVSFEQILVQDLISLHTPLTKSGPYPTWHLIDSPIIEQLRPGSILINAARGAVVNNHALAARLNVPEQSLLPHCVLDVWENEPDIDLDLLRLAEITTSHIAGYSYEGKEQGTAQIYQALTEFFDLVDVCSYPVNSQKKNLSIASGDKPMQQINVGILAGYGIQIDHMQLQQILKPDSKVSFDLMRKNYPLRREFSYYELDYTGYSEEAKTTLQILGFN